MEKLLTPEQYGKTLSPPKKAGAILRLLQAGRIPKAQKISGVWLIPEGARIRGAGRRARHGNTTGIGAKEFARKNGRSLSRAYQLLNSGRIAGATRDEHGWDIPESAPWPADDGF